MKNLFYTVFMVSLFGFQQLDAQTTPPVKQERTIQPTIIVIPRVNENEDIRHILEKDPNGYIRIAITKVKEAFDKRDFTTYDFVTVLKNAMDDPTFVSEDLSDLKSQMVEMSGADIYVEVEVFPPTSSSAGYSVRIGLQAADASTGRSLGNKDCPSRYMNFNDFGALAASAVDHCVEEFLNTVQTKFTDMVEHGRSIKVRFSKGAGAGDFAFNSTQIGDDVFDEVMDKWMQENAVEGVAKSPGSTANGLPYEEVRIPVKTAEGKNYKVLDFASKIVKFLKSKGISATRNIKRGTIFITINGKVAAK